MFAAFKAGLASVNTNYRYAADELVYLWDNADAVAVVFHGTFAERIEQIRAQAAGIRTWLWVDDGSGPCPDWAVPLRGRPPPRAPTSTSSAPWGRSGDHLLLLYTGGTTGMPKGVMWRQDDLFGVLDCQQQAAHAARAGPRRGPRPDHQARPAQPARRAAHARHRAVQRDAAT